MPYQISKLFFLILITLLLSVSSLVTNAAIADKTAGQLAKLQGTVLIRQDQSSKPSLITEPGKPLIVGNQLRTKKKSRVFIKWIDGSKIVMKEKSRLNIKAVDYLDVDSGQVMFDIAKLERPRPVRVGVKLAILGVRGTRFIVDSNDDEYNVYLKEGKVSITSLAEEFRVYKEQIEAQMRKFREKITREASKFKDELETDFETFKQGRAERVKEFDLIESAGISIKGNVITLIPIPADIDEEFKLLDSF